MYIYMYINKYIYIYICMCIHTTNVFIYLCVYLYLHIYIYAYAVPRPPKTHLPPTSTQARSSVSPRKTKMPCIQILEGVWFNFYVPTLTTNQKSAVSRIPTLPTLASLTSQFSNCCKPNLPACQFSKFCKRCFPSVQLAINLENQACKHWKC